MIDIAMKWTKVLRTGGIEVRFMAVDRSTVMFNMQNGKLVTEVKATENTQCLKLCLSGLVKI